MKLRTINRAANSENASRTGHQGDIPAPTSAATSIAKVEPTCSQLAFADSFANGTVALIRSLPVRGSSCELILNCDICANSNAVYTPTIVNSCQIESYIRPGLMLPRRLLVALRLQSKQCSVLSILGQQAVMVTLFQYLAVVDDDNPIRCAHGRETM